MIYFSQNQRIDNVAGDDHDENNDESNLYENTVHLYRNFHLRMSVKCPVTAAAAAIIGLTRCVRPPPALTPFKVAVAG